MKKLFNIIALSLAFAPALHGDVVRESVDTLKQHIATADAQAFEKSCTALLGSEITVQDRKNALAMLERHAQETKQQRQDELANMGDATKSKMTLAKGIAQTVGGSILGIKSLIPLDYIVGNPISSYVRESRLGNIYRPVIQGTLHVAKYLGFNVYEENVPIVHFETPCGSYDGIGTKINFNNPVFKGIMFAYFAAGTYWSYLGFKHGVQNIKNGWNYKEYLELQIASIDKIIACIQQAKRELK